MLHKILVFIFLLLTNITLFSQSDSIETISIGYNTINKLSSTNAVIQIEKEDFNIGNINNPYLLIQGKAPGILIAKPGGDPLEIPDVRIRNINSFSNNQRPLIVVDGIPDIDWMMLDPNDIEKIVILKDAASTAIYGIRGSSGVILVTTKKETSEKLNIQYQAYFSREKAIPSDIMSAETYRETILSPNGTDFGASTDWIDLLSRTANSNAHQLSFYGQDNKTTYQANLSYRNINGTLINDGFQQYNLLATVQHKALNDKLTANISMNTIRKNYKVVNRDVTKYIQTSIPIAPVYDTVSMYGGYYELFFFDHFNPLSIAEQHLIEGNLNSTNVNAGISYEIIDGLSIQNLYSLQTVGETSGFYAPNTSYYWGKNNNGLVSKNEQAYNNHYYEALIAYDKKLGIGQLNIVGGYNFQQKNYESLYKRTNNYTDSYETFKTLKPSDLPENSFLDYRVYQAKNTLHSLLTSANYNIDNTYFINFNYRQDRFATINSDTKIGVANLFGIGVGVDLAQMIKLENLNQLKIRANYGVSGGLPQVNNIKQAIPTNGYFINTNFVQSFDDPKIANNSLVTEKNTSLNIGADISIFNDFAQLSLDYYTATASNLLVELFSPPISTIFASTSEIQSNGFEMNLNLNLIKKDDFRWTINTNLSTTKNTLITYDSPLPVGTFDAPNFSFITSNVITEGQPIGQFFGFLYKNIDENGKWQFEDSNNNGFVDVNDFQVIGNGLPSSYLGFMNTLYYKKIDVSFFLRGVFGHQLANELRLFQQNQNIPNLFNATNSALNPDQSRLTEQNQWSDYFIEDASFLRIEYISLGYTFDIKSAKVRLYLAANNLHTFTKYAGTDAEIRLSYDNNLFIAGRDRRDMYLPTSGFLFGIKANF